MSLLVQQAINVKTEQDIIGLRCCAGIIVQVGVDWSFQTSFLNKKSHTELCEIYMKKTNWNH